MEIDGDQLEEEEPEEMAEESSNEDLEGEEPAGTNKAEPKVKPSPPIKSKRQPI